MEINNTDLYNLLLYRDYTTEDLKYLRIATKYSIFSDDKSTKNGAILVHPELGILSQAANKFPDGITPDQDDKKLFRITHAERNCIYKAYRLGFDYKTINQCTMYSPYAACSDCGNALIELGVRRLITHISTWDENSKWFESCVEAYKCMLENGIYLKLITSPLGETIKRRGVVISI